MKYKVLLSPAFFFLVLDFFICINSSAQVPDTGISKAEVTADVPSFKLFLIGDAGEDDASGATLLDLKVQLLNNPNSAVIFLGDNCYIKSFFLMPLETGGFNGSKTAVRRMMSQLDILRDYQGFACFIPGNHDWWNHSNYKKGIKYLLAEQKFIEDTLRTFKSLLNHEGSTFLPVNGTPGPVSRSFDNGKIRIIFMDTYRLLMADGKKGREDSLFLSAFYNELKAQLTDASAKNEKIIVIGHHPIRSKGKHSQPLKIWEKISRRFADSNINYPLYHQMAIRLDSLFKAHKEPDMYYVSGHEHSLEYFYSDSLHYIVSGAGSKIDKVKMQSSAREGECLQWNEGGFFEIDFYEQRETVLMYHRKDSQSELKVQCVAGCK